MVRAPVNDQAAYFMKTLCLLIFTGLFITATPVPAGTIEEGVCQVPELDLHAGSAPGIPGTADEKFKRLYDSVECLRKKAATKGAEWLDTETLLESALQEAGKGHQDTATQLLMKAHLQAVRALEQADHEAQAWKHRVIR